MEKIVASGSVYCRCAADIAHSPHIRMMDCPPYREPKEGGHSVLLGVRVHSREWERIVKRVFGGSEEEARNSLLEAARKRYLDLTKKSKGRK